MNSENKEYLVLAVSYLQQFKEEKGFKNQTLNELHKFLSIEAIKAFDNSAEAMISTVNNALNKITNIYNTDNVSVNVLGFILGACSMLIENEVFKGSKNMQIQRLTKYILDDVEKVAKDKKEIYLAMKVITKLSEHKIKKKD